MAALLIAGPSFGSAARADQPSAPGITRLTIEIRSPSGLELARYTLSCDPPAGTVRDPATACGRIAALYRAMAAEAAAGPPTVAGPWSPLESLCPPVYGGPEVMIVRGRLAGHHTESRYTREDGCAKSGFDRMARLLGIPELAAWHDAAADL